jgi:hypothetical protein
MSCQQGQQWQVVVPEPVPSTTMHLKCELGLDLLQVSDADRQLQQRLEKWSCERHAERNVVQQ